MFIKITTALATLALALNVFAADKKQDKKTASKEAIYKIDLKSSAVEWKGIKKIGSSHVGGIQIQSGQIVAEGAQIKSGEVVVDMKTITNTDLKDASFNKKLVGHLSNEDFFNVEKFPTSTFKITSVTAGKATDEVIVKGDLTIIGQTQAVEFPATVKFDKDTATGNGTLKIDRTKWGLKYGSGNFFKELAADKIINDEFELTLKLVAKK